MSSETDLPPAIRSMWRLCKLGYTHEPRLVIVVVALTLLQAVPDALFALWLALFPAAILNHDTRLIYAIVAAMAASATLTWFLQVITTRLTRRFRDRVTIALETHVATLQASVPSLELHERSDYLDRLAVLRNQVFVLDHMYVSLLGTIGWLFRVGDHPRPARIDRSAAAVAGRLRRADGDHLDLASRRRAAGRGVLRRAQPAGRPPVRDRDDRRTGEGGPGHRHRAGPGGAAPDRVAALVRPGRPSTLDHGRVCIRWPGRSSGSATSGRSSSSPSASMPASARCC